MIIIPPSRRVINNKQKNHRVTFLIHFFDLI